MPDIVLVMVLDVKNNEANADGLISAFICMAAKIAQNYTNRLLST